MAIWLHWESGWKGSSTIEKARSGDDAEYRSISATVTRILQRGEENWRQVVVEKEKGQLVELID